MPLEKVCEVLKIAEELISLETPIGNEADTRLGLGGQEAPRICRPASGPVVVQLVRTGRS